MLSDAGRIRCSRPLRFAANAAAASMFDPLPVWARAQLLLTAARRPPTAPRAARRFSPASSSSSPSWHMSAPAARGQYVPCSCWPAAMRVPAPPCCARRRGLR
jgi:hypothetical protein